MADRELDRLKKQHDYQAIDWILFATRQVQNIGESQHVVFSDKSDELARACSFHVHIEKMLDGVKGSQTFTARQKLDVDLSWETNLAELTKTHYVYGHGDDPSTKTTTDFLPGTQADTVVALSDVNSCQPAVVSMTSMVATPENWTFHYLDKDGNPATGTFDVRKDYLDVEHGDS